MENKIDKLKDSKRPKDVHSDWDWDTGGCALFIFADDAAANYDLEKVQKFLSRFKKKSK